MCQYSSVDGFANDWHMVHLGSRAVGGAGLVIQEASAVSADGRITPDDLGIYSDRHLDMLARITAFIHQQGAVAGIQLAHAGRKASHTSPWKGSRQIPSGAGGWKTVSASAIPFTPEEEPPVELDSDSIRKIVMDFGKSANRAKVAGYRVLEIHAAHGYLIHQFLSPLSNHRDDLYGGSFVNRARLLLEIINAVKQEWPAEFPLFVRLSCTDWVEDGWTIDDSVHLAGMLREHGADLIDCSSGGNAPQANIPLGPGYQVPFAERIRKESQIATAAVGLITSAMQAEDVLAKGKADLIIMARELLRDPYFPLHAAGELGEVIGWPSQYERARPRK
jgi:2,4-dienoyl-CoA reductase-like NADH-dependent reductase (Old Yellow Enzyme family)